MKSTYHLTPVPPSATGVCSNCEQWKHAGRCINDCQRKGFDTVNLGVDGRPRRLADSPTDVNLDNTRKE